MRRTLCIFAGILALVVYGATHPSVSNDKNSQIDEKCPVGQILNSSGKCVTQNEIVQKPTAPKPIGPKPGLTKPTNQKPGAQKPTHQKPVVQKPTNGTAAFEKRRLQRRRRLQRVLNKEFREMKRMLLDRFYGNATDVTCAAGQTKTEFGLCVDSVNATDVSQVNVTEKSQKLQRVEKELERALRKELQIEMRRRKRRQNKKKKGGSKSVANSNLSGKNSTTTLVRADRNEEGHLELCKDGVLPVITECTPNL